MALTFGTPATRNWRTFKTRYLALALVAALAATAAIGVASLGGAGAGQTGDSRPLSRFALPQAEVKPVVVMYIVDSQAQADQIEVMEAEINLSWTETVGAAGRSFSIFHVANADEEMRARELIAEASRELMQNGVTYEVFDLRPR